MTDFDELYAEIEAEAHAEGPDAVADLMAKRQRYHDMYHAGIAPGRRGMDATYKVQPQSIDGGMADLIASQKRQIAAVTYPDPGQIMERELMAQGAHDESDPYPSEVQAARTALARHGWNYRVVELDGGYLDLREVYYDADGKPNGHRSVFVSFDPESDEGDSRESMRRQLARMARALDEPTLLESDFTGGSAV